MVQTLFDIAPRMMFLFTEVADDAWDGKSLEQAHMPIAELFGRGQATGAFDEDLSIEWLIRALWYLVGAGW